MSKVYEFSNFLTAPDVRRVAAPYGAPQIVNIPNTNIPSPLAQNLEPRSIKDLKEFLTGCGPDGKGQSGNPRGVEIWESWKRAWDLWNNHYIAGREAPAWIKSEYERLKAIMDGLTLKQKKSLISPLTGENANGGPPGPPGGRGPRGRPPPDGNAGQVVVSRQFAQNMPTVTTQPDTKWIKHRYRKQKIKVPTGRQIRKNNPNPIPTTVTKQRLVPRVVWQMAGQFVKIYKRVPKVTDVEQKRTVRANGPWNQTLSWAEVIARRTAGQIPDPLESDDAPEPELEPLETRIETTQVQTIKMAQTYMDITIEEQKSPLQSWEALFEKRRDNDEIRPRAESKDAIYQNHRSEMWVPLKYDLVDTGGWEMLPFERQAEVLYPEKYDFTTYANPFIDEDEMTEIEIPQWLEVKVFKNKPRKRRRRPRSRRSSSGSQSSHNSQTPPLPPPVIPKSTTMDLEMHRTADHPEYPIWQAGLPARWDAVNPGRLSSTNDPEFRKWIIGQEADLAAQWTRIKQRPFPTHSNHPAVEGRETILPTITTVGEEDEQDEDMADVSDQEFQDMYGDSDEEMEDYYEQRALGDSRSVSSGTSRHSNDIDDGLGSGSESSTSASSVDDTGDQGLGAPERGDDGGAGGFFPMKLFDEYKPRLDANGDYEQDWSDPLMNTVWRPRRVGEKKVKIDIDEPWEKITDLEVDGGLDCGRSPFPVLRPITKYIRNQMPGNGDKLDHDSYRKEKVWDGVTGSIFNMPTRPDDPEPETLAEREERIKTLYADINFDEPRRHELFPLDIRRAMAINPKTGNPYPVKIPQNMEPGEIEVDFDFPWQNPLRKYPDMKENDPWWVTPEQEKLRDVPPRRHPQPEDQRDGDRYLPLDDYYWKEELRLDDTNKAKYFVTNLHGGTMLINGVELKMGCIAGPLPAFAIIETPGGQVSFWWGPNGRDWGEGPDNINTAASWRQLRRTPGWELIGLNAGVVWNRIIRDRLLREETGNREEDDEQWEKWKQGLCSMPPTNDTTAARGGGGGGGGSGGSGGGGNNDDDPDKPVTTVHPPVVICTQYDIGPPHAIDTFKPPDLFETEAVELQWIHTRAKPLKETLEGLIGDSQQDVAEAKALSKLIVPFDEGFWPGPAPPAHPEIDAQKQAENDWPRLRNTAEMRQTALLARHTARRNLEEQTKQTEYTRDIQPDIARRRRERQERESESRRQRLKMEQQIRDAQTKYVADQAKIQADTQKKEDDAKFRKRVLEEAANLERIIGVGRTITDMAQLIAASDTRRDQWTLDMGDKGAARIRAVGARAANGLPALATQPPISPNEFNRILEAARDYLRPDRDIEEEAQRKVAADAEDKKRQDAIAARAAKELADKLAERAKQAAKPPKTQADIDLEERLKRLLAQKLGQAGSNSLAEAQRRRDEEKRRQEAEDQRRAEEDRRRKERLDAAEKRRIEAERLRQEALKTKKTPAQLQQEANDLQVALALEKERQRRLAVAATRRRLATDRPPNLSPAEANTLQAGRKQTREADQAARDSATSVAASFGQTLSQYVKDKYGFDDVQAWIDSLDNDKYTRQALPTQGSVGPDPNPSNEDVPPNGNIPPPNSTGDPGPPLNPVNLTADGNAELRGLREEMRNAARQGLEARAELNGIPQWQAAQIRGFQNVPALINTLMRTLTEADIFVATDPDQFKEQIIEIRNTKILNGNDWDAVIQLSINKGPQPPLQASGTDIEGVI